MTCNTFSIIDTYVEKHRLLPLHGKIVLGLSGGPDSVFLFYYLLQKHKEKKITLFTAHLDHQWHNNSFSNAMFCQQLSDNNNIIHSTKKMSELCLKKKYNGSKEAYARHARRIFFSQVKKKYNGDYIALAHHENDVHETFFIRLIRGSALTGLGSIYPKKDVYIRPLLAIKKEIILTWLTNNNKRYVIDPTTISTDFLRNRIRTTVLPALNKCDTRFEKNLTRTIKKIQQADTYIKNDTKKIFTSLISKYNPITIDVTQFLLQDQYIQKQVLLHWLILEQVYFIPTDGLLQEIIRFLQQSNGGTHTFYKKWNLHKKNRMAVIVKI